MRATRRYGASIPAGLTEALQEFETAGDLLNERKRFSGKLSDRVLPLRVDGGVGIASGGESDQRGARTHPAKSQHLCRTAWAEPRFSPGREGPWGHRAQGPGKAIS